MEKLFLLIGMIVFLVPSLVSAETNFTSDLPKCKIKNNEIKSKKPCYGKIVYPGGNIYEGEFGFRKGRDGKIEFYYEGKGTKTFIGGKVQSGIWKNNNFIEEVLNETDIQKEQRVATNTQEEQLAEYEKKYCQNNVVDKIAILHPDGYFECTSQQPKEKTLNQNNNPVNFLDTEGRIYCLRNNGTVYDIADSQSCEPNKEISLEKFIAIKGQKDNIETDYEKKLIKLKSLFEKELITQEEYDAKRKEILYTM